MPKPAPVLTRYGLAGSGLLGSGLLGSGLLGSGLLGSGLLGSGLLNCGVKGFGLMLVLALASSTACTGPQLHIDNQGEHQVFIDGRRTNAKSLPFRYYGTSRWTALPQIPEVNGVPAFDRNPHTETVVILEPSNPWLFPFDFPLEALHWLFLGQSDQTVTVSTPMKPPEQRVGQQIAGEKLSQLSARARQARTAR
ncbi:MAG: hypothetical protein ACJAQZ_002537 [Planctomycetota bacterium]|jgi:hypothetical protein